MNLPFKNLLKDYGWTGLFLAVVLILNVLFIFSVQSSYLEFSQKNEELSLVTAKKTDLLQLSRDREKIEFLHQEIGNSFVSEENLVDFIEYLENTAESVSGSLAIGTISDGSDGERSFKTVFFGSYSGLINFLARLENSPYLLNIVRVDGGGAVNSETKAVNLRISIDLKVLSL